MRPGAALDDLTFEELINVEMAALMVSDRPVGNLVFIAPLAHERFDGSLDAAVRKSSNEQVVDARVDVARARKVALGGRTHGTARLVLGKVDGVVDSSARTSSTVGVRVTSSRHVLLRRSIASSPRDGAPRERLYSLTAGSSDFCSMHLLVLLRFALQPRDLNLVCTRGGGVTK
jgi:hypothetical protein